MKYGKLTIIGIIISIIFVIIGCIWLSLSVETLDEIAENFGVKENPIWNPPLPDYELPGFEGNVLINTIIGIVFTIVVFIVTYSIGNLLKIKESKKSK
jgi:amino acid transporter